LAALLGNQAATLVAIVEPQEPLAKDYAAKYHLDAKLSYADLEKMLVEQHPDAVLVYTTIADHRKVIETAARHGVSSMVENPLATTLEDALAIRAIAHGTASHSCRAMVLSDYRFGTKTYRSLRRSAAVGTRRTCQTE
jgi:glucose-fructose oxidoreductase